MAEVRIENLKKDFSGIDVIRGIDLHIKDKEFIVLVGPSGCGKSTLLRMIAGLEDITGGELRIGGETVNDLEPRERGIAMVFQSYALYPHMTVEKNMSFSMTLEKQDSERINKAVTQAAESLKLTPYLDRLPRALSGGQRQRVAMGRAIVRDPKLFLFDEPLSNLDAQLRVQMRTEVRKLHQRLNATSIYVTHDQVEAMTMADRIVVLDQGTISQVGTPLELYDRPANKFVAEFIGSPSINILPAKLEGNGLRMGENGSLVRLEATPQTDSKHVEVGIRPEHLFPAEAGSIEGEVQVIEHLGAETYVFLTANDTDICWRIAGRYDAAIGDKIRLGFDSNNLHIFEADSGRRIPGPE
ncbi:glycerol-3-phosphate ABC transporter ATP-binding protein [Marinobacterium aestuarii]|uniref:Glycerol-3-phosphate ABC transporter ATP-binding protein n=1 Tax=Marinobacterium aestuarii TaxID=1821621 RepID=A0A1A9EZG4_9GAMM|nr:sn-glycerol-3-phosphate ABC transporter ATP-binding protein UgpC [Marinobacterium aestuarii]ANG63474.1 glycerol-3-phosphate ABC transporter ATP-binding protein [Marinobacterium aestuarii]